jgi:SWI/SNF-related matrix-associated actin-dependent regulator of chromatin subfamily A-like protein 1
MTSARLQLLPFQHTGAWFLATRPRALLADEQRVGKTPQAIRACDLLAADSILVLCPAIARVNWLREFGRFSDRTGAAVVSAKDPIDRRLTVCSYDNLIDAGVYARLSANWDVVIMDEAHYCKNLAAQRTQAAFGVANGAWYAWALSGTPAPANASELHPLLSRFGITRLSYWEFVRRYCKYHETPYGVQITGNKNVEELRELLTPIMLRRRLAEVAPDMPPARWSTVTLEPGRVDDLCTREEMRAALTQLPKLQAALDRAQDDIERLGDAARDYRRLLGLQKVAPLVELLTAELDSGTPNIVVFGWHRDVIEALTAALRAYGSRSIHGGTSDTDKAAYQEEFRTGTCRVLGCQIVAAGTAIDLSVSDDLLFAELDYTPGNNSQAAMRCVSQFKRNPVRVRVASVADSLDERINEIVARKSRALNEIFS